MMRLNRSNTKYLIKEVHKLEEIGEREVVRGLREHELKLQKR